MWYSRTIIVSLAIGTALGWTARAAGQLQYAYERLPEPTATTGSEPQAIGINEEGIKAPGRIKDDTGVWHAFVWESDADPPWTGQTLPVTDPTSASTADGIECGCDSGTCECTVVGSTGNPGSEQPAIWGCTGSPCSWASKTINLPVGFSGGSAKKVVKFRAGADLAKKVTGVGNDSGGTPRGIVWAPDASGNWQPTLLPALSSLPGAGCQADGVEEISLAVEELHIEIIGSSNGGGGGGDDLPVAWNCNTNTDDCTLTGSWTLTELPLLGGGSQGTAKDVKYFVVTLKDAIITGTSGTGGSGTVATHAAMWRCNTDQNDCTAPGSWTVTDLGTLPGYTNSVGIGISEEGVNLNLRGQPSRAVAGLITIVGSSYDTDPDTDGVATLWEVDTSVTPPDVTAYDLNDLAVGLPPDVMIAKGSGIKHDTAMASIRNMRAATAAAGDPHAAVLTEFQTAIPTASAWGLLGLAVLLVAGGALVCAKRVPQQT